MTDGKKEPWEDFYQKGAPNWRGSPFMLPEMEYGSRFLDIGCGTGSTLIRAVEKGFRATGIDISPTALKTASDRLEKRGIEADLLQRDISRERIDGDFDLIAIHYVLGSMIQKDRISSLDNIMNVLKKGGIISFEDLSTGDIREMKGERIEEMTNLKGNGIIQHFFDINEVRGLFTGLSVLELKRETWEHSGLQRARLLGRFQLD